MKLLGESCAFHILSWSNKHCCQKWPSGLFLPFCVGRVITEIVLETNHYAQQCIESKLDTVVQNKLWGNSSILWFACFLRHQCASRNKIVLVQGSSSPFVKRVIWRDRFNKLNQYLHLNNKENFVSRGERNHTKLFKICLFLEAVIKGNSQRISP